MIRTRLALWNAVVLALVLGGLGTILYITSGTVRQQRVDAELLGRVGMFKAVWADFQNHTVRMPPPDHLEPAEVGIDPDLAKHIALERKIGRPMIFYPNGKNMLYPQDRSWDFESILKTAKGDRTYNDVTVDGVPVRVLSVPVWDHGHIVAVGQLATPLDDVASETSSLGQSLLLMLPLAIVATSLTGFWLTKHAMKPVRDIARAAELIEATNLGGRLPVRGQDEFAELAITMNGMLSRLQHSFRRLENAYDTQRRFTADASHELKTPLTTIKARVGIAQYGEPTKERLGEHIHAIEVAADSMTGIVQDLLLLALSDEGRLELRCSEVTLSKCIQDAILCVKALEERSVRIYVPPQVTLWADESLLRRALVNLLGNAACHTPEGGKIGVEVKRLGIHLMIRVYDGGEGIPPDHLPFIFERFHRVDSSRNRESGGTGLGLAIVKSIIAAHGGRVEVQSELGKGTSVNIVLPREAPIHNFALT